MTWRRAGGESSARPGHAAEEWLTPPVVSPDGRDSLGRGLDSGNVAAAGAASGSVQRERGARWSYLQGAYRDPYTAQAALDELIKREGWTKAAARLASAPEQLGDLLGKVGWLASAAAKQERAGAERAAAALPGSLGRIGEAESRAERTYRGSVDGQRTADATDIPRLSVAAAAAIGTVHAAPDKRTCGEMWRAGQQDERLTAELDAFRRADTQRFGDEGLREMLRSGGQPGTVNRPSITPQQQKDFDRVADLTATFRQGERAATDLAESQAESERRGQRRGLRM